MGGEGGDRALFAEGTLCVVGGGGRALCVLKGEEGGLEVCCEGNKGFFFGHVPAMGAGKGVGGL